MILGFCIKETKKLFLNKFFFLEEYGDLYKVYRADNKKFIDIFEKDIFELLSGPTGTGDLLFSGGTTGHAGFNENGDWETRTRTVTYYGEIIEKIEIKK